MKSDISIAGILCVGFFFLFDPAEISHASNMQ